MYDVERAGGTTNRLVRYISGPLPPYYWEDAAHVRAVDKGVVKQMICMHSGTMLECIEKVDEKLHDLYTEADLSLSTHQKKKMKKAYVPKPITVAPRSFFVYS